MSQIMLNSKIYVLFKFISNKQYIINSPKFGSALVVHDSKQICTLFLPVLMCLIRGIHYCGIITVFFWQFYLPLIQQSLIYTEMISSVFVFQFFWKTIMIKLEGMHELNKNSKFKRQIPIGVDAGNLKTDSNIRMDCTRSVPRTVNLLIPKDLFKLVRFNKKLYVGTTYNYSLEGSSEYIFGRSSTKYQ